MRALARNAGHEPASTVEGSRQRGPAWAFDTVRGEWVNTWKAGILDPVSVVSAALNAAVSAAAVALTSDVLIHRKNAPMSVQP